MDRINWVTAKENVLKMSKGQQKRIIINECLTNHAPKDTMVIYRQESYRVCLDCADRYRKVQ